MLSRAKPETWCGEDSKTDPSLGDTGFLPWSAQAPKFLMALPSLSLPAGQFAMPTSKVLPFSLHVGSCLNSDLMALPDSSGSLVIFSHSGIFPNKMLAYLISG